MAKLPVIRRISREDLKDAPSWIERLLYPINLVFDALYIALNKGLTFQENINSTIRELDFTTESTYISSKAWVPIRFTHGLRTRPYAVLLCQIFENEGVTTPITEPVYVDWIEINGQIVINFITGLTNDKTYKIRVLVL